MIFFRFHGELKPLLTTPHQDGGIKVVFRRASVKDMIEALGVPHPEIGAITTKKGEVTFYFLPEDGERIEVSPLILPTEVTKPSLLRPEPLKTIRFVADLNVSKLGRLLRMAGFDVGGGNLQNDAALAEAAAAGRILLTRDRQLLKRRQVIFGHLVRACEPQAQFREVVKLYGLAGKAKPFTRCMLCNTKLHPVSKEPILPRLEPLTRKYYDVFAYCTRCDKVYWAGSHREKMAALLAALNKRSS
jgi:uncharacterized protein